MSIKTWPLQERPREKLLHKGADYLSDAELLAIFLRTGCKGKSAVDLAREVLSHFGSLRALFNTDLQDFCKTQGLGATKYVQLQAVLEMSQRYLFETVKTNDVFTNSESTKQYLITKLGRKKREVFWCLFLDAKHRIIDFKELFQGSIDQTNIYPGVIVESAIKHHASAIIFAHNHPSGDPKPSQADIQLTKRLKIALALIDIKVLDHIVVGAYQTVSFAEWGLI